MQTQGIKTSRAAAEGLTARNTDDESQKDAPILLENRDGPAVRSSATQTEGRKKWSIKYFIPDNKNQNIRLCKKFHLATLDVSQRCISHFHATKQARMCGKHVARAA